MEHMPYHWAFNHLLARKVNTSWVAPSQEKRNLRERTFRNWMEKYPSCFTTSHVHQPSQLHNTTPMHSKSPPHFAKLIIKLQYYREILSLHRAFCLSAITTVRELLWMYLLGLPGLQWERREGRQQGTVWLWTPPCFLKWVPFFLRLMECQKTAPLKNLMALNILRPVIKSRSALST